MCTVSWQFGDNGYQLYFNRDEVKTRQRAQSPIIKQYQHTRFIAPTDLDAGGTWISVNEHGMTLCLLNNYAAQVKILGESWISRGLLVHELSHAYSIENLINNLNKYILKAYRPFDLVALSLSGHSCQLSWNGDQLGIINNPQIPLTSSSFQTEAVISSRLQQFHQNTDTNKLESEQLKKYHASHIPERGAFSVCMHRDNGQTVSFSHISVNEIQANFDYFDGSPCSAGKAHTTKLDIKLQPNLMSQQPLTVLS